MRKLWMAAAVAAMVAGCGPGPAGAGTGTDDPPASSTQQPPVSTAALLPLSAGNRWQYKVTDSLGGAPLTKDTRVVEQRQLDGKKAGITAWVLESVTGSVRSVVYVTVDGAYALRQREDEWRAGALYEYKLYDPGALRGPFQMLASGASKHEQFTEDTYNPDGSLKKTQLNDYDWSVEAIDEPLTTPAGSFKTVKLKRTKTTSGHEKTTWWAPGVGKIKEVEDGVEELLQSYDVK